MSRASALRAPIVAIAAWCLAGCAALPATLVYLDTASAELAAYAERFNAAQERYRVVPRFVADPAERLARGGGHADVLIGPWLASAELRDRLRRLDPLFRTDRLDAAWFYPALLRAGQVEGAQVALPLSFSVPAVVVRSADVAVHPFSVGVAELTARSTAAASWDAALVYRVALLHGAAPRIEADGEVVLRQEAVDRAVALARDRIAAVQAEGVASGRPQARPAGLRALLDGRIDFIVSDPQGVLEIPEEQQRRLSLSWLGAGGRLRPADDLIYAAIPAAARNPRGARSFLLWLFTPATQTALLDLDRELRLGTFGIAGGLPALIEVTTRELAARHPFMLGRAPAADDLAAPAALSADWGRLHGEVVLPWLRAALDGAEQQPLAAAINAERQRRRLVATADGAAATRVDRR